MKLVMEKKYFYKNNRPKLFIWLFIAIITLLIIGELFSDTGLRSQNRIFFVLLASSFLIQYFLYKRWYIKIKNEAVFIRKSNLFTTREIPFSEILSQRLLVTGDLELSLHNEKVEILKDLLKKEAFQEIHEKIQERTNKVTH